MLSKKRFTTHVNNLSSRINLTLDNIEIYCQNNNVSPRMERRLRAQWYKDNPVGRQMDIYEAIEIERQRELDAKA